MPQAKRRRRGKKAIFITSGVGVDGNPNPNPMMRGGGGGGYDPLSMRAQEALHCLARDFIDTAYEVRIRVRGLGL